MGDQLWNSGRQLSIFSRIGDQEGAISDPAAICFCWDIDKCMVKTWEATILHELSVGLIVSPVILFFNLGNIEKVIKRQPRADVDLNNIKVFLVAH